MLKIDDIKLNPDYTDADLLKAAANRLKIPESRIKTCKILKKSVDARKKSDVHYILSLAVEALDERKIDVKKIKNCARYRIKSFEVTRASRVPEKSPVIAGTGPAGLFCALTLAYAGLKPIVIERGKPVGKRVGGVEKFFERGELDINSNIQFGEGGAGTFSDGKLTTGTKDERQLFVTEQFIKHGAPKDIEYLKKPHIGTDKLREIIPNIRETLIKYGCEIKFECTLTDVLIKNNRAEGVEVV